MKTLIVAVLIVKIFVSVETVLAAGYVLENSTSGNGSLCRQPSPMNIAYYNAAGSVESQDVPLAAETWNDVPAVVHFTQVGSPGSAVVIVNSTNNPFAPVVGRTYNSG